MNRRDILKSLAALPGVASVERLDLSTASAIVISYDAVLSHRDRDHIQREVEAFARKLGRDIPCLVLDGGLTLKTLA